MVGQTVQQGCGEAFIAKDLDPIGELEVGGQDQCQALVELGAKSEQHLGAIGRERDEAKVVQKDQVHLECCGDKAMQAMLILGQEQLVD